MLSVQQKVKKTGQIGQQAEQKKHFLLEHQILLRWAPNIKEVSLGKSALRLSAVGNWAGTLGRKELCDSNHKFFICSRVHTTNIPALKDSEMESFRNTHHASCQADTQDVDIKI